MFHRAGLSQRRRVCSSGGRRPAEPLPHRQARFAQKQSILSVHSHLLMGYPWFEATARRALNVFEILFF